LAASVDLKDFGGLLKIEAGALVGASVTNDLGLAYAAGRSKGTLAGDAASHPWALF